ncbi:hypothetical protein ACFE04_022786 [Oxalis oulophora]
MNTTLTTTTIGTIKAPLSSSSSSSEIRKFPSESPSKLHFKALSRLPTAVVCSLSTQHRCYCSSSSSTDVVLCFEAAAAVFALPPPFIVLAALLPASPQLSLVLSRFLRCGVGFTEQVQLLGWI